MKEKCLQTEAFHKDMEEAIKSINERFHLDIKCGIVTLGNTTLTISLTSKDE